MQTQLLEFHDESALAGLDLVDEFLANGSTRKGKFSSKTIYLYKPILRKFEKACSGNWANVRLLHLQKFILGKTESDALRNLARACLSSFFTWLEANDVVMKSPCRGLPLYRTETSDPTKDFCITHRDYKKMLSALPDTPTGRDYRFTLMFLRFTGIRLSETQSIASIGVDWKQGIVRVLGKGNKKRWVPFPLSMRDAISKRLKENGGRLFVKTPHQIWYAIKKTAEIAGIQEVRREGMLGKRYKVFPHALRHLFSDDAGQRGMSDFAVEKILGHSLGIRDVYTKNSLRRIIRDYRKVYK